MDAFAAKMTGNPRIDEVNECMLPQIVTLSLIITLYLHSQKKK